MIDLIHPDTRLNKYSHISGITQSTDSVRMNSSPYRVRDGDGVTVILQAAGITRGSRSQR